MRDAQGPRPFPRTGSRSGASGPSTWDKYRKLSQNTDAERDPGYAESRMDVFIDPRQLARLRRPWLRLAQSAAGARPPAGSPPTSSVQPDHTVGDAPAFPGSCFTVNSRYELTVHVLVVDFGLACDAGTSAAMGIRDGVISWRDTQGGQAA
jgi:hypothetical protein